MDRRDRWECTGLGRAIVEAGFVGTPRRGRVPRLPSRDHALLPGGRGRDRGPDRRGYRPPAPVGSPRGCPPTALALDRRVRRRNRRESPLPRLAGILRFATVPSLERAVVLRRLDRNRRSFFLAGTARGARVGRAPPLETGAGVPRHALGRHDSRGVARRPSRRVVGARGDGRVRRGRRGGLDAALVRGGRAPPRRGVWAGRARGLHRPACRGERPGQSADSRRRDTAVWTRCLVGGAHDPRAPVSLGSGLRVAGQRRGTGMGRGSTPRPSRRARGAPHHAGPRDRAIRAVPRGGRGFERRRRARGAVGCALPWVRVGGRWLGQRAGAAAMSHPTPPADLLDDVVRALTPAFRLDQRVAATPERAVYHAWDRVLKRSVALHVHLAPDTPGRAWFLRETETLAALDHPAIRHVYAAGLVGSLAYRTANWVEGESLAEALRRGPRAIPTAHALVRDLLGAAEHAHARGVILRRIVPLTLMLDLTGRAVITDLRYCNWCLPNVPPEEQGAGGAFVAPEVRAGDPGEPRSDVYGVAALVYYVLTGQEPDLDPARITPPRQLRPAVPAALERVLLRALQAAPSARYYTATEMLEDFVSDAGVFQEPAAAAVVHDGARAGEQPGAAGPQAGTASARSNRPPDRPGPVGAGARARARPGASGLEAREHVDRAGRPVTHHRLRAGARAARRRPLWRRHVPQRHAAVRVAGAAAGRTGGSARRSVFARRHGVLRPAGPPAVRGTHPGSDYRAPNHRGPALTS